MDNKVTKKRFNDQLEYDWFKYVAILLVAVIGCYFIFSQIVSDRDYETIDIFVSTYSSSTNDYEFKTMQAMGSEMDTEKYGGNYIRTISFNPQSPVDSNYATLLSTQGNVSSDFLIVGKAQLYNPESEQFDYASGYVELSDEMMNDYLLPEGLSIDDLQYAVDGNGKRRGVRVDNFERMSGSGGIFELDWRKLQGLNDEYKDRENQPDLEFYLVINPSSVSIGKFGKKSKDGNAQALFCIKKFIQFYRGIPREA